MKEINAVKMSPNEQEIFRMSIIRMYKKGKTTTEIVELTSGKVRHIQSTIQKYKQYGIKAIKQKRMGRPKDVSKKLTNEQQKVIQKLIVDKTPDQLKMKFVLWDRTTVSTLILEKYGIKMPLSTMGYYLNKWGFTAQRPFKQNYKQNPRDVKKWLEEDYPIIKKKASRVHGIVYWGDETGIQNENNYIKGYAPKGQPPILKISSNKISINMISAVTNQGKLRFMCYEETMTQQVLITFMKRLVKESDKKIFLILDNLKVHHGLIVAQYIKKNKKDIELFYLPAYAPERNPDEYLNGNLKRELAKIKHPEDKETLRSTTRGLMMRFQNNAEHLKSYFKNKYIKYASGERKKYLAV
jgi:transposase